MPSLSPPNKVLSFGEHFIAFKTVVAFSGITGYSNIVPILRASDDKYKVVLAIFLSDLIVYQGALSSKNLFVNLKTLILLSMPS